jgi:hypothetical protein
VSSAAEKSASLPQRLIRHALAVIPALNVLDDAEKIDAWSFGLAWGFSPTKGL